MTIWWWYDDDDAFIFFNKSLPKKSLKKYTSLRKFKQIDGEGPDFWSPEK